MWRAETAVAAGASLAVFCEETLTSANSADKKRTQREVQGPYGMIKKFATGGLGMRARTMNSVCGAVLCLMAEGMTGCSLVDPLLPPLTADPVVPACDDTTGRTLTAEGFATITVLCGGNDSFIQAKLNGRREVIVADFISRLGILIADGIVTDLALRPSGINDNGQVVGSFGVPQRVLPLVSTSTLDHPAIWESGVRTQLSAFPGGENGTALAINNAGTIVGWAVDGPAFLPFLSLYADAGPRIPSMWRRADDQWQISRLDGVPEESEAFAVNEREQVLIRVFGGPSTGSFLWEAGVLTELPTLGGDWTEAWDINDGGQVIGTTSNGQFEVTPTVDLYPEFRVPVRRAFLWQDGEIRDLGTLGGQSSEAIAINNLGQVIGRADAPEFGFPSEFAADPIDRPFLWQEGVMVDLNDLVPPDAGVTITSVFDINDVGQILAWARFAETDESAMVLVDLPD